MQVCTSKTSSIDFAVQDLGGFERRREEQLPVFFAEDCEICEACCERRYAYNRAENKRYHRNSAAALYEAVKQFTGPCEGSNTVVSALAPAVPKADDWRFDAFGHFDQFGDFLSVHFPHAASMYAEVLGETVNPSAVDCSVACYNTVAKGVVEEHAVVRGSMGDKRINFDERVFIQKHSDAVPCGASST